MIGSWDASNNASRGYEPFPIGTLNYLEDTLDIHTESKKSDAVSSSGTYIFDVPGRSRLGVHAGRKGITDKAGRTGWQHATEGCIRTIEDAMAAIRERFSKKDPLTHIKVEK